MLGMWSVARIVVGSSRVCSALFVKGNLIYYVLINLVCMSNRLKVTILAYIAMRVLDLA